MRISDINFLKVNFPIICLFLCIALISDCRNKKESGRSGAVDEDAGTLQVGTEMTDEIGVALAADEDLDEDQVSAIKAGALEAVADEADSGSSLWLWSKNEVSRAATAAIKGAISVLDEDDAGLNKDSEKIAVTKLIAGTVTESLNGKIDGITAEDRSALPGEIAEAAISALDEGGLDETAALDAVGDLMNSIVGALDDAGFGDDEFSDVFTKLAKDSIGALDNAGISEANFSVAIEGVVGSALGAIDQVGFGEDEYAGIMDDFVCGAFDGFEHMGLEEDQFFGYMDEVMEGAIGAFDDLGIAGGLCSGFFCDVYYDCLQSTGGDDDECSDEALTCQGIAGISHLLGAECTK